MKPVLCVRSHSEAIPVPTQIHNYQRMEQNLQPSGSQGSTRYRGTPVSDLSTYHSQDLLHDCFTHTPGSASVMLALLKVPHCAEDLDHMIPALPPTPQVRLEEVPRHPSPRHLV